MPKCSKGKFGLDCSEPCDGCIESTCDRFNGECVDKSGCKPGYEYGRYCNKTCITGKYGLDCSESCDGCIESKCDRLNGDCFYSYGCKPGYEYGRYCNRTTPKCDKGKFGLYCSKSCDGCIESICNRCDGVCIDSSGCKPGYEYGPYCNKTCMNWHFGTNCTKICYCLNNPCEKNSGICSDGGCKKGWHGQSCDEECSKGTFGLDCSESCDGCIESACDRFNGECVDSSGCKPGYEHGPYCNKNTQMSLPASSGTAIRGGISAAIMIIIIKIFEVNYVI
ncbi:multiple epidermal growth factor-like domains protein 10 [Mytilus californianus]|uniref:multiple epidermal growth factor-like domains protein 10 n=1 Tax=Mytilus californianus TaxID=6549 RepID=UPI0022453341|nr:multiple epidermal growth factor-like domains protein 10 [Mytilus californianus]